jgi:hypothetical protein
VQHIHPNSGALVAPSLLPPVSSMVSCNTHDFLVFIQFFVLSNDGFGLLRSAIECWVEFIPFFYKNGSNSFNFIIVHVLSNDGLRLLMLIPFLFFCYRLGRAELLYQFFGHT